MPDSGVTFRCIFHGDALPTSADGRCCALLRTQACCRACSSLKPLYLAVTAEDGSATCFSLYSCFLEVVSSSMLPGGQLVRHGGNSDFSLLLNGRGLFLRRRHESGLVISWHCPYGLMSENHPLVACKFLFHVRAVPCCCGKLAGSFFGA